MAQRGGSPDLHTPPASALPKVVSFKDLAHVESLVPSGDEHICSISVDEHFMFYDKSIPNPYLAWVIWVPFLGPYLVNIAVEVESIALDLSHLIFLSLRKTPLWFQSIAMPLLMMGPMRRPLPRLVYLQQQ